MKQEIERKFLVSGDSWRAGAGCGLACCQGYITAGKSKVAVRVRLMGGRGFLTVKGPVAGFSRPEFEYEIPAADAAYMFEHLCTGGLISKKRYTLETGGQCWEIDEFLDLNEGLIVAEIELESEGQSFEKPVWLGPEVSFDPRYTNVALAQNPFSRW